MQLVFRRNGSSTFVHHDTRIDCIEWKVKAGVDWAAMAWVESDPPAKLDLSSPLGVLLVSAVGALTRPMPFDFAPTSQRLVLWPSDSELEIAA